jgi:hypothetical protein
LPRLVPHGACNLTTTVEHVHYTRGPIHPLPRLWLHYCAAQERYERRLRELATKEPTLGLLGRAAHKKSGVTLVWRRVAPL